MPARLRSRALDLTCRAAQALFALPGYRLSLIGRTPASMIATPADLWAGDVDRGAALITGNFVFAGVAGGRDGDIWAPAGVPAEWLAALHGFGWLRDLRALGGDDARHTARRLAADWIVRNRAWSLPAWRSDVLAARLAAWLSHYDTFFASGEDDFRRRVVGSIARQTRHLDRAMRLETQGARRITALKGRILASLCLEGSASLDRNLLRLDRELDRQVLADGGHVARSPHHLLTALQNLLEVRAALAGAQQEVPGALQAAIDRMGPMLRYLRHGDGGFARFNGAGLEDPALVEAVAEQASPRGKPAVRAPAMGFERLSAGPLTVLVDSGAPPPPRWDDGAHAGTLSLEVSAGNERLIVNCGAAPTGGRRWLDAQRATAAHSTAVVRDRNSSELLHNGQIGRRRATTTVERDTDDGAILLSMSHDGYARPDGIVHRRRLFLSADGEDLRGEDILSGPKGIPFTLRFHLHPSVRASLLQSGQAALLKPPGGGAWRLHASAPMELAESIYFESAPEPRRTSQIVISGNTGPGSNAIKWALHREGRRD
ncbi:MAG: heparinase II/III family protein [Alphaproteobacteria bacterium]|nr:heparinase II/III family protein [Alphaproteobacteria bacterium]